MKDYKNDTQLCVVFVSFGVAFLSVYNVYRVVLQKCPNVVVGGIQ